MILSSDIIENVAQVFALAALSGLCLLVAQRALTAGGYRTVLRYVAVTLAVLALSVAGPAGASDSVCGIIDLGALLTTLGVTGWLGYRLGLLRQSRGQTQGKHGPTRNDTRLPPPERAIARLPESGGGTDEITEPHQPDVHAILRRSVRRRAEMRATLDAAQADHAAWSLHFRESFEVPGTQ